MKKNLLYFLLLGAFLSLNANSAVAACLSGDCASLGYTRSASDCSGIDSIRCPFDLNKYFCVSTPTVSECLYMETEDTCQRNCSTVGTKSCSRGGITYYQSCSAPTCGKYANCVNSRCICKQSSIRYQKNGFSGALQNNLTFGIGKYWFKQGENLTTSGIQIRCTGNPGTDGKLSSCSTRKFFLNIDVDCVYDVATLHHTRIEELSVSLSEFQRLSSSSLAEWCKLRVKKDEQGCLAIEDGTITKGDLGL